jgi:uncharacterized protein YaeQ
LAHRFIFHLKSDDGRRPFPHKIIVGQGVNESVRHVAFKFLAWLLFFRDRLQIETMVPDDNIPFVPDLVELGYDMRPRLWVECGECTVSKLHKLAVKCPEAEIWIVKRGRADAEHLLRAMAKEELRRDRYSVIAFEPEFFDEVCGLLKERNDVFWYTGGFDPAAMQFELNELWFDTPFEVLRH